MSLFQGRDWWRSRIGSDEVFSHAGLCVANIDNDRSGAVKIITGSLAGVLRIYAPSSEQVEERASDLLLEQVLSAPILQVESGRFVSTHASSVFLAVLHPRSLAVYSVTSQTSNDGTGSVATLELVYQHELQRNAYSMIYGPFGGVYDRDFLCVQSMDGQLAFFEQEAAAFTRQLPNQILPGAMVYVKKTDSIVTCSANYTVDAYRYQVLASAGDDSGRKVQLDWSTSIGEWAHDILIGRISRSLTGSQSDIVVLGDRHLFCLKENGAIRSQKRLDYHGAVLATAEVTAPGQRQAVAMGRSQNLLVGTNSDTVMVYRDAQLAWRSRLPVGDLVAMSVAVIAGVPGMIVTLSMHGSVGVCFLGTEASKTAIGAAPDRSMSFKEMASELRKLQAETRAAMASSGAVSSASASLALSVDVPDQPDAAGALSRAVRAATCTLRISNAAGAPVRSAIVTVDCTAPFLCETMSVSLDRISDHGTTDVPLVFTASRPGIATSLEACVHVAYRSSSGEPRCQTERFSLPLWLGFAVVPPIKSSAIKYTLATDQQPVSLQQLFPEMAALADTGSHVAANVMSVLHSTAVPTAQDTQHHDDGYADEATKAAAAALASAPRSADGNEVSIICAKSSGKYRVQGASYEATALLACLLADRLRQHFAASSTPVIIDTNDALPIAHLDSIIDERFAARQAINMLNQQLEQRATQFRAIQKRLLARYKDKNATPLQSLDVLLDATHHELMQLADACEYQQVLLAWHTARLQAFLRLVHLLLPMLARMDDANQAELQRVLPWQIHNSQDGVCWEDVTEATLVYAL